ncbi:winged helix-turn-helix transcriptional regulator [Pseudooceanicola aestuarii]|uniref:winged helix-turn-helix transcriptional regulator n=1 Tax=Pseudooceanicola aestuarii TaxID=2697319 RepID=UPI0019544604|nr:helix-turn-helix domain-containing protein [Pseudooceanicola aestuarii]
MKSNPIDTAKLVRSCSIWRALDDVGDVPTMLILQAFWLGERRFEGFRKRTGLLKAQLSQRLQHLTAADILVKRLYCERPPRYEYILTEKGRDLYGLALAMLRWEEKWAGDSAKFAVRMEHVTCGATEISAVPLSLATGQAFTARSVTWQHGPGMGWITPQHNRRHKPRGSHHGTQANLLDVILRVLGDRWSSLVLRAIFTGERRYDQIQKDAGIATNILVDRLQSLSDIGMIRKQLYSSQPPRYEYRLTEAGVDYYPVLVMLMRWGDRWYATPEGPPLELFDRDTGAPLNPAMVCSACKQPLHPADVRFRIEPARNGTKSTVAAEQG